MDAVHAALVWRERSDFVVGASLPEACRTEQLFADTGTVDGLTACFCNGTAYSRGASITEGALLVVPASKASKLSKTAAAAKAGPKRIVIGEDMEGRVIPTEMNNNRRWLNDRMDEGCAIFDCGPAPGRARYPEPTSPYYQMERDEIARRGYPTTRVDGPE